MAICNNKDLIQVVGALADGRTLVTRHRPDHTVVTSTIRPMTDGKPLAPGEECITTRRRDDGSHEIVSSYVHTVPARGKPAQVATEDFRAGWERTFNAPGGSA
jgi:hypothetical protein